MKQTKSLSELTWCPKLHDFTLKVTNILVFKDTHTHVFETTSTPFQVSKKLYRLFVKRLLLFLSSVIREKDMRLP